MTCDSHRRRQTSGLKPNGDCSFGSLAAADDCLWAKIHEFCQVSHKFLVRFSPLIFVSISFAMFPHVFMLFLPHLCLLFRCHLLFMILELILCIVFFHDFCNVLQLIWRCDCWDLYLRSFPSSRKALEVSTVTLAVGSEVWRGTWHDLLVANGSHMTYVHAKILQKFCYRCSFIFWIMKVLPRDWHIVAMSTAFSV